jgi:F-type H+-transporting ATPase subunit b
MDLLTPDPGLVIWTGLTFIILLFLLKKYAWRPILHAIRVREHTIKYALAAADRAKQEVENIAKLKKQTLEEAALERDKLITEARELKAKIIEDAKKDARREADKIVTSTRQQLEKEKKEAVQKMREQVAILSVNIAGKLLEHELKATKKQKELIEKYMKEVSFN